MHNFTDAEKLLKEYVTNESLLRHGYAVSAALRWYATHHGLPAEQVQLWATTGLLHDFDYERYPTAEPEVGHPFAGNKILKEQGYPAELCEAIMGHAVYTGVPRSTLLAKTLFACDELCGLIVAAVWVRPDKSILTLEPSSVIKKMKDKAFARGCNRDDIVLGAQEIGIELQQHIANCIEALRGEASSLGLVGSGSISAAV